MIPSVLGIAILLGSLLMLILAHVARRESALRQELEPILKRLADQYPKEVFAQKPRIYVRANDYKFGGQRMRELLWIFYPLSLVVALYGYRLIALGQQGQLSSSSTWDERAANLLILMPFSFGAMLLAFAVLEWRKLWLSDRLLGPTEIMSGIHQQELRRFRKRYLIRKARIYLCAGAMLTTISITAIFTLAH